MVSVQAAVLAMVLSGAGGETVLLDFYADWCGPCRQMNPVVKQLISLGYPIRQVNFDQNRALAEQLQVRELPSFVLVVDGRVADRQVGLTSGERLAAMCRSVQGRRPPTQVASAPRGPLQGLRNLVGGRSGGGGAPGTSGRGSAPASSDSEAPAFVPGSSAAPATLATGPAILANTAPIAPAAAATFPVPTRRATAADQDLIAASVRLRIEDKDGQSCGTGTIIDAQPGKALILTCGHIFRDSHGQGRIEVDLFGPQAAQRLPGYLIAYDDARDVGLLQICVNQPVVAAKVAPPGYRIAKGDSVISLGCDNGAAPSVVCGRVVSLDRYQGPPNLQVSGRPVQGRSGGGLFSAEGYLIGVCNAADPPLNEGLYAALPSIHAELDRVNLAAVYRPSGAAPASRDPFQATTPVSMPRTPGPMDADSQVAAAQWTSPSRGTPSRAPATLPAMASNARPLPPSERDALEEIGKQRKRGAEIVVVIRSADGREPSQVLVMDDSTPGFVDQLARIADSRRGQEATQKTSMEIKRPQSASLLPGPTAVDPLEASARSLEQRLRAGSVSP